MSEFRQNYVTKEWVVIAPERGKRPDEMSNGSEPRPVPEAYRADCPFCVGNEDKTPAPVHVVDQGGAWKVRVVPNKFAALKQDEEPRRGHNGLFLSAGGFGIAEVVIESPHHDQSLGTLSVPEVEQVLLAFRTRHLAIASDPRINLVTIFRNYGPRAGTSLEHPHSQIIATPIVPPHVRDPWRQAQAHFDTYGRCPYCEMVRGELEDGRRILCENDSFVSFAPFASKSPFETRIYPKRHHASYSWLHDRETRDLARILKDALLRLRQGLGNPDYNLIVRSAGSGDEDVRYLHWYMVIIPKITTPAGFEIGSGIYINVTPPEQAAEFLRGVTVEF